MTEKKEQKPNIYQLIHRIMEDVKYVKKENKKVDNKYTYVSHDAVTAVVREALVKHGVVAIPSIVDQSVEQFNAKASYNGKETQKTVYFATVRMDVTFINIEDPEDRFTTYGWAGMGLDPQDKAVGKATSYAYKYCLLKTFALETGDDVEQDQKTTYVKDGNLAGTRAGLLDSTERQEALDIFFDQTKESLMGFREKDIISMQDFWIAKADWIKKLAPAKRKELEALKDNIKEFLNGKEDGA